MSTIGERIRNTRKKRGITQEALAEAIGKHPNLVARWERGEVKIKAETIKDIAFVLDVPTSELIDDDTNNTSERFIKTSEYKDKTEVKNNVPNMTYWGALFDNAEKAAESGKNLETIICIVQDALNILKLARDSQIKS